MGIFVDYYSYLECSEEEVLERLGRFRERVSQLDVEHVGEIVRVEPIYNFILHQLLERDGYEAPPAVQERIPPRGDKPVDELRALLGCSFEFGSLSKKRCEKFWEPAREFLEKNILWDENDYPEELAQSPSGYGFTFTRRGISLEFAQVLLRYGYALVIDPAPGCESMLVNLSTLRSSRTPVWAGWGFTKTQYAEHFVPAHELVCHIVDLMNQTGLLHKAKDTCGYYEHRDWSKSARVVNLETTFATAVSKFLVGGAKAAREAGADVEIISAPALNRTNLVVVKDHRDESS